VRPDNWAPLGIFFATMATIEGAAPLLILTSVDEASLGPWGTAALILSAGCSVAAISSFVGALWLRWSHRKSEPESRFRAF